jgi:hypothetical protein
MPKRKVESELGEHDVGPKTRSKYALKSAPCRMLDAVSNLPPFYRRKRSEASLNNEKDSSEKPKER